MKLKMREYTCDCGHAFKSPALLGDGYGHLLLNSEVGEIVYLNAFTMQEFDELAGMVRKHPRLKGKDEYDAGEIIQSLFSLVCDLSPQQKIYFLAKYPNCPRCHSPYDIKNWKDIYPYELVDMDLPSTTFAEWNRLNKEQKEALIEQGMEVVVKKREEYMEEVRRTGDWPNLSHAEKSASMEKTKKMNTKNFKLIVSTFRTIRGLDPQSPIV